MGTLHTLNKSPFSHTTSLSCFTICDKGDSILFIEDGVLGALPSSPYTAHIDKLIQKGVKIYALEGDVKARGIQQKLDQRVCITDYDGFVQLSIEHSRVQSWY
jgi:tRNA 2-thiouridine synthesizing protein B